MKQQTHDGAIALAEGCRQRAGVRWNILSGETDSIAFLEKMHAGSTDPEILAGLDAFRAYFAEHGDFAVLIIAFCDVRR